MDRAVPCSMLKNGEWQRSRELVESARRSGRSTFSTARACAQLQSVPESSRMHIMWASARVVASAESLHLLPQTAFCDCRSCPPEADRHVDTQGLGYPREIAVALSRTAAASRGC